MPSPDKTREAERSLAVAALDQLKPRQRRTRLLELLGHCGVLCDTGRWHVAISPPWTLPGLEASVYLTAISRGELTSLTEEALASRGIAPPSCEDLSVTVGEPRRPTVGGVQ